MKRSLIIYSLILSTSFFLSSSIQAQQQKKPSERSFAAEINKVKEIQATRNAKVSQMQQPSETTAVASDKTTEKNPTANKPLQDTQVNPETKPSTGPMKQAKKPVVSNG